MLTHQRRRALALLAGTALGAAGLVGLTGPQASAAGTTYVVGNPATCPTAPDFRTIPAAVAAASSGDTIKVCAGSFGDTVVVDKPGLTFQGAGAGVDARTQRPKSTVISNPAGDFVLNGNADDTTIDGFVLTGATDVAADGVAAFRGSSGLTLVNNVIQFNGNGVNMQNPDGSKPALVSQNRFNRNSANYAGSNGNNGTGVFISSGPANNTLITDNAFLQHEETAINFGGDPSRLSEGLVVTDNRSTNDGTFVVAGNSNGAVIDHNSITTDDAKAIGGMHGTGILDFGSNTGLRIASNVLRATGNAQQSSGISVANYDGSSANTSIVANQVVGFYNDIKVGPSTGSYVADNKLRTAESDGIIVRAGVSGAVLSHNTVTGAGTFSCEDPTTGTGTAGTANTWRSNHGDTASSPAAICPGAAN